jgi:hypothetical protein
VAGQAAHPARGGDEVGAHLGLIELHEQRPRLVLVTRVAAPREQRVGREGDEAVERQAARDVLDVRVQAPVLVHHQHQRQRACGLRRPHQVTACRAMALRRGELDEGRPQPGVRGRHLLCRGEVRAQRGQHRGGRTHAADMPCRAVQEASPVDQPVHVLVEQAQQLGVEVGRGAANGRGHGGGLRRCADLP